MQRKTLCYIYIGSSFSEEEIPGQSVQKLVWELVKVIIRVRHVSYFLPLLLDIYYLLTQTQNERVDRYLLMRYIYMQVKIKFYKAKYVMLENVICQ